MKVFLQVYILDCIISIVKDLNFWEKWIFESIRRELKNDFFEYDYEADTENAFREIIYYRLSSLITTMLNFGISKNDTKSLVTKFWESHDLRQEQCISLISKIANFGKSKSLILLETLQERKERERNEQIIKENMGEHETK